MTFRLKDNPFRFEKVLVTGGSGFIGTHLVNRLVGLGAKVFCLGVQETILNVSAERIIANLADISELGAQLSGKQFAYVFNLGGYIGHNLMANGGREIIDVHFIGLLNLIQCVGGRDLKGFVQVGSSDEYGNASSPQAENVREMPISCYSLAKTASSHMIQMLASTEGLPSVGVRLFLTYGPGQDMQRFFPQIIRGCLENKVFPVSEGRQLRDFCYVDDIVEGLLLASTTAKAHGDIINLASGKPVEVRKAVEIVRNLVGKGTPNFGEIPYRPQENMSLYADVSKAKIVLGWQAETPLEEGLEKTIAFFRNE